MEWARFIAAPRSSLRASLIAAGAAARRSPGSLVRPLRRRVTDEQVALYLEEHEPSLQATLLSAVEATRAGTRPRVAGAGAQAGASRRSSSAAQSMDGPRVERLPLRRYGAALGARRAVAVLALPARPGLHPPRAVGAAAALARRRGGGAVPHRGQAGQRHGPARAPTRRITAKLLGFDVRRTVLMMRKRTPTGRFERVPLVRNEPRHVRRHAVRRRRRRSSISSRPTACSRRSTR